MRKMTFAKRLLWMLMFYIFFISCEDNFDKHFDVPDWLKGSAWEVLESKGNYTIFLKGIELSGYQPIVEGKNILTIMAPDDEAFKSYLNQQGKSSIEDYSSEELRKLIGFHLMYYSYNTNKLINFRPEGDGASEEEREYNAGLYYKHRTKSYDQPTLVQDGDSLLTIYHNERFLPVFSYRMFQTKKIDAKSNYEYFYPNSTWTGASGFNVSNASVEEYQLIADNGYVYLINQVLEPLETIYTEMMKLPEYSRFLELYDRFSYYEYDATLTVDFGDGVDLYRHYHEAPLANIACEWPVPNYRDISDLSSLSYSVFAPSNTELDNFFTSYWQGGGYSDYSEVPNLPIKYLLNNHVYTSSIVFPEEITRGDIESSYRTPIEFDVDKVAQNKRKMTLNGTFYGLDEINVPDMFYSVTGAAFKYNGYLTYLYMLDASSMLLSLASEDVQFTLLVPSDEQMENSSIIVQDDELYRQEGTDLEPLGSAGNNIVNLHLSTGDEIKGTPTQVLRTNLPFNYLYVKDNTLTTSVNFSTLFNNPNSSEQIFVPFTEITNEGSAWSNGKAYSYGGSNIFEPNSTSIQSNLATIRDRTYPYYMFSSLLRNAELADLSSETLFTGALRCVIFIPQNEVIEAAIQAGEIPGVVKDDGTVTIEEGYIETEDGYIVTNQNLLALYLRNYFLSTSTNSMTAYPYIGSGIAGPYNSLGLSQVYIIDTGQQLSIQLYYNGNFVRNRVNVIPDYNYFPFAFNDAGIHYIDGVL